jgi:hypothetical protein
MAVSSPAFASSRVPSLAGPTVVEGSLSGAPSLSGDRVALYAMPPQSFMNKLRVGESFQGKLVGSTTSSPTGAYTIRVSDPEAITSSSYDGIVNFQVWAAGHVAGHAYNTFYGFSRRLSASGALVPMYGRATAAPERASIALHQITGRDALEAVADSDNVLSSDCWTETSDLGPKWTTVAGLWSTISPMDKYLTYTTGASSSVSIGVSINAGPWATGTAGNTTVTSDAGSQGFPDLKGINSALGQTKMEEGFFQTCQISSEVSTFPYAVDGGDKWIGNSPPQATYCVSELANSKVTVNRTQAFTFSDGLDLQDTYGISLAATTGYSSTASIEYDFPDADYACGTASYPLRDTAHGVVADASSSGNS